MKIVPVGLCLKALNSKKCVQITSGKAVKMKIGLKMRLKWPYLSTAVSAGIQMEKALGLYKHLSFLFIYSLSDRFTKNL